jgi:hypothetical protein
MDDPIIFDAINIEDEVLSTNQSGSILMTGYLSDLPPTTLPNQVEEEVQHQSLLSNH